MQAFILIRVESVGIILAITRLNAESPTPTLESDLVGHATEDQLQIRVDKSTHKLNSG